MWTSVSPCFKALEIVVSKVTLAFLESCCRRERVPEWRVYDVCAQMRAQVNLKKEARLNAAIPIKVGPIKPQYTPHTPPIHPGYTPYTPPIKPLLTPYTPPIRPLYAP